jgi:hypothetical protein
MISSYDQLAVVRRQLTLAEDALVSLHERLHARNPRNYALFAESYIDMILQLRAEIDAFLEIQPAADSPAGTKGPTNAEPVKGGAPVAPAHHS